MNNKKSMMCIYTLLHFLVDLTTVYLVTGVILGPRIAIVQRGAVVIVYNLVAFAGQLPIGILSDAVNKNRVFVAAGCLLAGISYPIAFVSPWTACVVVALGNGLFHVGAGSDVLKYSMPRAGLSGLFVSSGALGVWLAYKVNNEIVLFVLPVIMFIATVAMFVVSKRDNAEKSTVYIRFNKPELIPVIAISCFMLTIVARSLLGMVMNYSWKAVGILSFVSVLAVVFGKAFGGYIGDRFGYMKTAIVSLGISLVLFIYSFDYWVAGVIAIMCFNMTMPLTLTAIADLTDKKYGFAFGLTTFALALGVIPDAFGASSYFSVSFLLFGVGASLILLTAGYIITKKYTKSR